jgi:hypothetical protein
MDTSDLHILPSISPEISVDQEIMPRRLDDSSVTFEESMVDEPQFQKPQVLPETDIAPSRDLFYNPLSWQRSQLSYRNGNCKLYSTLSPAEEARLRSIAMPAQPYPTSPVCSPPSPDSQRTRNRHNRTSSETSESDCLAPRSRHVINKKKAHSVTEKRYRTNLTDKITVLRDRIPSLRVIAKNNSVNEDLEGVSTTRKLNKVFTHNHITSSFGPAKIFPPRYMLHARFCVPTDKLNQGTILSEATEYIGHLERRTKDLTRENKFLKARIEAFELLAIAQCTPNYASPTVITGD